jgi:hypothetical protein
LIRIRAPEARHIIHLIIGAILIVRRVIAAIIEHIPKPGRAGLRRCPFDQDMKNHGVEFDPKYVFG